jgi:hypothetical protein
MFAGNGPAVMFFGAALTVTVPLPSARAILHTANATIDAAASRATARLLIDD